MTPIFVVFEFSGPSSLTFPNGIRQFDGAGVGHDAVDRCNGPSAAIAAGAVSTEAVRTAAKTLRAREFAGAEIGFADARSGVKCSWQPFL